MKREREKGDGWGKIHGEGARKRSWNWGREREVEKETYMERGDSFL